MSQKSEPAKLDIFKVDTNDCEIVERISSNNSPNASNGSIGKEFAATAAIEIAKAVVPVAIEMIKGRNDDDRDEKKKIREDRRAILQRDFNNLIKNIEKEEAKEDYNQERIDKWYERIDKIKQELNDMEEKADGFTKGLLKSIIGR
ncbi:hypothetical protein [Peribacillus frigoritolerans]|uniref:hypothetical protein n=1 Tax=Peribacillus frigoritolerans TaxID=450367 RepID=UPI0007BF2B2F|nr:hypothetical protein [Peribacillus frigoritolerans]MCM3169438.1 hypothetical protein [Peribacillus frigoritolerans]